MANVSSSNSQEALVPKLRFPGFEEEWQRDKLSSYLIESSDLAEQNCGYPLMTSSRQGLFIQNEYFNREKKSSDETLFSIVPRGYITYRHMSDDDTFHFNINNIADYGLVSKEYPVFTTTHDLDSYLLVEILNSSLGFRKFCKQQKKGGTRTRLYFSALGEYKISLPSSEEQGKLSRFLQVLDVRIEKQRQLVDFLKSYKRGLSSALFERKVRIKRPDGSLFLKWKSSTLGNIFLERTERASGDENLLAVTINSGVQERSNLDLKDNSSEDKSNYRRVYIGDIAYNTMRMWQGACGVSAYNGIVSPAYTVLYVADKSKSEPRYWAYLFKETRMLRLFQRNSQGLTSDTWNLKYDKFSKITVDVPSVEEQVVIANYLDTLSSKIAMHEDSLKQLERYKQSLLSQMFI